jgi:arginine decarboxylase
MDSNAYIHDAPLLMALLEYADQRRVSLHMPGHQDGRNFPENFSKRLAEIDSTELAVTDDLNQPNGPAAKAMQAAAAAFGAADTLFVTGGSTTALYALISAYCPKGSKIVNRVQYIELY